MGRVAACSPASGCLSCYLLDIWRSESPPVHQRMALTSVFKIPLPWPCGIPAHMVRGPPSVPLLPGDPLPPAPVLPAFFQQLSLLISFIIHKALPEQGERVLFHRKGGDVAINAVTATCTFRIVFFPHLGCPVVLTVELFLHCVTCGVIVHLEVLISVVYIQKMVALNLTS